MQTAVLGVRSHWLPGCHEGKTAGRREEKRVVVESERKH